jgi:putative nucleotidyltransferase with HDIG domain
MLYRDQALQLLKKYLRDDKLLKHSYAVEAILRAIAHHIHEDEELWSITGLLHDLDYEYTREDPGKHASMTAQLVEGIIPDVAVDAIKAHNYMHTDQIPMTALDKALIAADAVSGLIIATALVMPSKHLADVRFESLQTKYKDTSFAAGCNRKRIQLCDDFGMDLPTFLNISLTAMKNIAAELGL